MEKKFTEHKSWETLLSNYGSQYYRGLVQPIEIYRAKGCLKPWALCEIAQHAIRNMDKDLNIEDIIKLAANPHPSKSLDLAGIDVYRQYNNPSHP